MNDTRRTRLFLLVLVSSRLQNSVEHYQPEVNNLDASDLGPAYYIIQNPDENIEVKLNSLEGGNQNKFFSFLKESNTSNIIKDNANDNKLKDKSPFEVETERVVEETEKLRLHSQEQDVGLNAFKLQSEKEEMKNKEVDIRTSRHKMRLQETDIKNQGSDTKVESSNNINESNLRKEDSENHSEIISLLKSSSLTFLNVPKTELDENAIYLHQNTNLSFTVEPNKKIITAQNFISEDYADRFNATDLELNANRWTSLFKNESYNYRISRRSAENSDVKDKQSFEPPANTDDLFAKPDYSELYRNARNSERIGAVNKREVRCKVPKYMKYSALQCRFLPTRTECHQECVFGYNLISDFNDGGLRTTQICYHKKGTWYPDKSFSDCKPIPSFTNCYIRLLSGRKKCIYNYKKKGPLCYITCNIKKKAKKYTCDGYGRWDPKLPNCVSTANHTAGHWKRDSFISLEKKNIKKFYVL